MGVHASTILNAHHWLNLSTSFIRRKEPIPPVSIDQVVWTGPQVCWFELLYWSTYLSFSKGSPEYRWGSIYIHLKLGGCQASEESRQESCGTKPLIEDWINLILITQQVSIVFIHEQCVAILYVALKVVFRRQSSLHTHFISLTWEELCQQQKHAEYTVFPDTWLQGRLGGTPGQLFAQPDGALPWLDILEWGPQCGACHTPDWHNNATGETSIVKLTWHTPLLSPPEAMCQPASLLNVLHCTS